MTALDLIARLRAAGAQCEAWRCGLDTDDFTSLLDELEAAVAAPKEENDAQP